MSLFSYQITLNFARPASKLLNQERVMLDLFSSRFFPSLDFQMGMVPGSLQLISHQPNLFAHFSLKNSEEGS